MIVGNAVTLGGGASLNIDYGTSAPADISKLWVPLTAKPNNVDVDLTVPFGNEYIGLVGSMDRSLAYATGAVVDGVLYLMAGGNTQSQMPYIYRFDKATGKLVDTGARLPSSFNRSSAMDANGSIYVVGGIYSTTYRKTVYKYTPATNTVVELSYLPYNASKIALAKHNGKIYFFGGLNSSPSSYYGYIDPSDDSVVSLGTNSTQRRANMAAGSWGNYIYLFGGNYGETVYSSIVRYDVSANTFSLISATLPQTKLLMGYAQVGQYVYIFGGNDYSGGEPTKTIYRFDCASETVVQIATSIPVDMYSPGAAADGNSIYLWDGQAKVVYDFVVQSELASNNLYIQHDYYSAGRRWIAINGKTEQVKLYPINVFLGNSAGIAEKVNAYLYNSAAASWETLDGVSMTADMLNALAALGVT